MRRREKDTQPGLGIPASPADPRAAPASNRQPTVRGLGAPTEPTIRERSEFDTAPDPSAPVGSTFPHGENDSLDDMLAELTRKRIPVPTSFEPGRREHHDAAVPPTPVSTRVESAVILDVTTEPPAAVGHDRNEPTFVLPPPPKRGIWIAAALVFFFCCGLAGVLAWRTAPVTSSASSASVRATPAASPVATPTFSAPTATSTPAPASAAPPTSIVTRPDPAPLPSAKPLRPTPQSQGAKTAQPSSADFVEH